MLQRLTFFLYLLVAPLQAFSTSPLTEPRKITELQRCEALLISGDFTPWLERMARVAAEIERRYPSAEWNYLFIGTSPTPIAAYFEARGFENLLFAPLSGMRMFPIMDLGLRTRAEATEYIFSMFTELAIGRHGGRDKILAIDFSEYGASIENVGNLLRRYSETQQLRLEIALLSLSSAKNVEQLWARGIDTYVIDAEWYGLFMAHLYQNTARFPRFDPLRTQNYDISEAAVNEEYRAMVERIRRLIL